MRFTKRNQKKITKRNEILLFTKQNETKQNFAGYFVSRNKQNFAKHFFVSLCFVFRETKKGCEMETLMPSFLVDKTTLMGV
jgi:hypothetical protein